MVKVQETAGQVAKTMLSDYSDELLNSYTRFFNEDLTKSCLLDATLRVSEHCSLAQYQQYCEYASELAPWYVNSIPAVSVVFDLEELDGLMAHCCDRLKEAGYQFHPHFNVSNPPIFLDYNFGVRIAELARKSFYIKLSGESVRVPSQEQIFFQFRFDALNKSSLCDSAKRYVGPTLFPCFTSPEFDSEAMEMALGGSFKR